MDVDVAIIGGGPVGLTLANLLGRRGVRVVVLEKRDTPYPWPRAIHFDGEVMRCFQAAGLADQILAHTHVGKGMLFQDPAGRTLIDWSRDQALGPMGWHESYRFFQPGLEAELRTGLGRFEHVTHKFGAEVVACEGTQIKCANGISYDARFFVAADGAASSLRGALGIALDDLGFEERWMVTDLLLTRERPDLGDHSIQYCDAEAPATYVRGVGSWRRWEIRLEPSAPDILEEAEVWRRLSKWISPNDATLERAAVYTFRSRVAETWRAGDVFLAGDAAHQMPPFMGQGMCAGIRDAANLAWKIAAVLAGYDESLLDTYQTERDPNVRTFIERSVDLGQLINQTALGRLPTGRMKSLWPALGPGLGPRQDIGGQLAPQPWIGDRRADDLTKGAIYALNAEVADIAQFDAPGPAQLVRPDGYALGPADQDTVALARALNASLASRPWLG